MSRNAGRHRRHGIGDRSGDRDLRHLWLPAMTQQRPCQRGLVHRPRDLSSLPRDCVYEGRRRPEVSRAVLSGGSPRPAPFFIGNHLALDFINTIATPQGAVVAWLCDGEDLVRWLVDAQVIDPVSAERIRTWRREALDEVTEEAREFRKWLRSFVTARSGKPLRATVVTIAPLNELLVRDKSFPQVEVELHKLCSPATPSVSLTRQRVKRAEEGPYCGIAGASRKANGFLRRDPIQSPEPSR
jgi:hypothetical protein